MTRLLTVLALVTAFLLIIYFTGVTVSLDPELGDGWYLVGPTV